MQRSGRPGLASVADALTLSRLIAAVLAIPLVWNERWTAVAVLLALAWVSDLLDGRLARASGSPTRLGAWDMRADTAVGAGLVIGLIGQGSMPAWAGLLALTLLGGMFLAGNLAAAMLLQLTGFIPVLVTLWGDRPMVWWLPFAIAVAIGVADWRRLFTINIPAFVRGVAGRFENR